VTVNKTIFRPVPCLLGLTALILFGSTLPARAQTPDAQRERQDASVAAIGIAQSDSLEAAIAREALPEDVADAEHFLQANPTRLQKSAPPEAPEAASNEPSTASVAQRETPTAKPIPGTVATSASLLSAPGRSSEPSAPSDNASEETEPAVAQIDIEPGRATRGISSYIGIGGNIGLTGDTALGDGSFVVNSKLGLTPVISFRPAAYISGDATFFLPVTYDFVIQRAEDPFGPVRFVPFVGGGLAISTDEDDNFGFALTGGVDVPISPEFIANASINVGFLEDTTDVGLTIGVGYAFPGF
jgi:hypothetical protein